MSQFDLPLPKPVSARPEEFLVGPSNTRAVHAIEHWGSWPVMTALLVGPRKSGRSMLARLFVAESHGTMIDDADRVAEAEVFHAWNRAQADRRPLLLVADAPPPEWAIRLPDLRSRINASQLLTLYPPDDTLVRDLLVYLFERRDLDVRPDLIAWLHKRVERTHLAVLRIVDRLEEVADARRSRRLSIPIAREALATGGYITGLSQRQGKLEW
ncbi:chromosomal replication initiator DnaA [Sphingomonas donggukensis]|uniref:Chromosomal replication initiator DnaA n=1 Tax=Sphingomonas donggukensis TaxID=2949093 RepID=A0ABY4TWN4_9SPHN|nr:chromosomal replication initiator DnaA [Sphingomonas donggukensis]URW76829.1 chromosomal replication initiator DnaA [Sphingomonas donggukensis]